MDLNNLTSDEKTVLYIFGVLRELKESQMIQDGEYALTDGLGVHVFDNLITEGFKPDMSIVVQCLVELEICHVKELYYFVKIFEEVGKNGIFKFKEDFEQFLESYGS